jgi:hypothetical protein
MKKVLVTVLAVACVITLVGCGSDEPEASSVSTDTTEASSTTIEDAPTQSDCGVTLADVQALLPPTSGVSENATPDARRCNFTWDDDGPRGIDVAMVPDARSSFDVPAEYTPLEGYGDEAYSSSMPGRASAVAFVGDDLYAVDVFADVADDDLSDLCLQLLERALPE